MPQKIFISYRLTDDPSIARLVDRLRQEFPGVYDSYVSLPGLKPFECIKQCDLLIAVIDKNWNPGDHSYEIEIALSLRKHVILVFLDHTDRISLLTSSFGCQGLLIRQEQFHDDVQKLIRYVLPVGAQAAPTFPTQAHLAALGINRLVSAFFRASESSPQVSEKLGPLNFKRKMDNADCSVFAPASPYRGHQILVQALLHNSQQLAQAAEIAAELDPSANRKGFTKLSTRIARGTQVQMFLEIPALDIIQPLQEATWEGEPVRIVFPVNIPTTARLGPCQGTLHVMIGGLPVGEVIFELNISEERRRDARVGFVSMDTSENDDEAVDPVAVDAKHFRHAFISYSRKDVHQVLLYAEALDDCGVELLMDLTAIEPGAEWELELSKLIGKADVFYLMWSKNAAGSQWVDKETRTAVQRYDQNPRREPRIRPVLIEQPTPDPPDHLKRFHFNSKWLALRAAYKRPLFSGPARSSRASATGAPRSLRLTIGTLIYRVLEGRA